MRKRLFSLALAVLTVITCATFVSCKQEVKETVIYTVTFESMGGTVIESQQVEQGKYVIRPEDPTKEGDIFLYWQLDGSYFDFENKSVNRNMTLKARWAYSNTVTYKVDDKEIVYQQVMQDALTVKPTNPTKENRIFTYWRLEGEKEPFDFENTVITKNITLKAHFIVGNLEEGQIMFYLGVLTGENPLGMTSSMQKQTAQVGQEILLPVIYPQMGDEFYGWVDGNSGKKYLMKDYQKREDYKFVYDGKPLLMYALGKAV